MLTQRRLLCFLLAQFLGALNDNALKMIVSLAAFDFFAAWQGQVSYLSAASAVFILPFILCSLWAGRLMDGQPTTQVLKWSKYAEVPIVALAYLAYEAPMADALLLMVLFLMAAQSAVFSPAKYGFLPEIVPETLLPKVNAVMLLSTYVAILGGTVLGSMLYGRFAPDSAVLFAPLLLLSLMGAASIYGIGHSEAKPALMVQSLSAASHVAWQRLAADAALRQSFYGQALFWFIGAFLYLVFLSAGHAVLGLAAQQSGLLFAFLAVGIITGGFGAVLLSRRCGHKTALRVAAVVLSAGLVGVMLSLSSFIALAASAAVTGIGGGLWMVPLVTRMQQQTALNERGRVLALTNMHNMAWVLAASLLFWLGAGVLAVPLIALVSGVLLVLIALVFWIGRRA